MRSIFSIVILIALVSCHSSNDGKTSYKLTSNGFRVVTHEPGDTNLVEQYYLDGSLKGLGIEKYEMKVGRWIEFYPNGDTLWDGYYNLGNRLYPTNFHLFRDSTTFETDYQNGLVMHSGDTINFNFKNKNVHTDEIEIVANYNCVINRTDPFMNSGYSFQMVIGQSKDSASFNAEARVFLAWPICHFKVSVN